MKCNAQLPEGYVASYGIDMQKNKKLAILVNVMALIISVIMVVIGVFFVKPFTLFDMSQGLGMYFIRFAVLVCGMVVYIILHEAVHGVFMKLFGAPKVKYGFTGLYAYAGSDAYFDKSSYIIIALAPVVIWGIVLGVINALVSAEWFWIVYIIQITNISGAAGDIYVTYKFSREPKDILICDSGVAMTVYHKHT